MRNGWQGFLTLGTVFLVVTGGEALYADLGHFGKRPIRFAWFMRSCCPRCCSTTSGRERSFSASPTPLRTSSTGWRPRGRFPAHRTGDGRDGDRVAGRDLRRFLPHAPGCAARLHAARWRSATLPPGRSVRSTFRPSTGPSCSRCIGLVLGFQTSSNLAAAYGVAVTTTWSSSPCCSSSSRASCGSWSLPAASSCSPRSSSTIDLAFFGANIVKIAHGGWFPLIVAGDGLHDDDDVDARAARSLTERMPRRARSPTQDFLQLDLRDTRRRGFRAPPSSWTGRSRESR